MFRQRAHRDYQDPTRFFTGTHPTENLKLLIKEITERLAGIEGGTPIFREEFFERDLDDSLGEDLRDRVERCRTLTNSLEDDEEIGFDEAYLLHIYGV